MPDHNIYAASAAAGAIVNLVDVQAWVAIGAGVGGMVATVLDRRRAG